MERQGEGSPPVPPVTEATAAPRPRHSFPTTSLPSTTRPGFRLGQPLLIDQRNSGKFIHHSESQGKPAPAWRRKCGFWD